VCLVCDLIIPESQWAFRNVADHIGIVGCEALPAAKNASIGIFCPDLCDRLVLDVTDVFIPTQREEGQVDDRRSIEGDVWLSFGEGDEVTGVCIPDLVRCSRSTSVLLRTVKQGRFSLQKGEIDVHSGRWRCKSAMTSARNIDHFLRTQLQVPRPFRQ